MSRSYNLDSIPFILAAHKDDRQIPIITRISEGSRTRIYRADFPDGQTWACRVPLFQLDRRPEREVQDDLERAALVLKYLRLKGFQRAPEFKAMNLSLLAENGPPLIAYTWMPGKPLVWNDSEPPRPLRDKVLKQLADIHVSLLECTKHDKNHARSPAYYEFKDIIDKSRALRRGYDRGLTARHYTDQSDLLGAILMPELEEGPFATDHGAIEPKHIIVDDEYNITGIIHWDDAFNVPFQQAALFPHFLRFKAENGALTSSLRLRTDQHAYIEAVQDRKMTTAVRWMNFLMTIQDANLRACCIDSIQSVEMHKALVENKWKIPSFWGDREERLVDPYLRAVPPHHYHHWFGWRAHFKKKYEAFLDDNFFWWD
ncbi:hypothetical protein KEM56_004549 [Ascosphaera pollenicola]|nr:hypothetical protein KEM56_004549 [Ascosphaera pollenicola]